jgi:NAD(P)-dependent dehydrogenase (short-subunit alcohol dehydrogenase family)
MSTIAPRCRAYTDAVAIVAADLADPSDRLRIVPEAVVALGGPIDVLVNNAAAGIHMAMAEFPHKRRRIMFEVNVEAPLDLAQAVVPAMREAGEGWIVNLSSAAARPVPGPPYVPGAMPGNGIYGATKAALDRATNALAAELWGTGIRINTLDPVKPVASEGAIAHLGDHLVGQGHVGAVAGHCGAQVVHHEPSAFAREVLRVGATDPAARAGDDHDAAVERAHQPARGRVPSRVITVRPSASSRAWSWTMWPVWSAGQVASASAASTMTSTGA